jgi:hypothetical protein
MAVLGLARPHRALDSNPYAGDKNANSDLKAVCR